MGDGSLEAGDSVGQGFALVGEFGDSVAEDFFGLFFVVEVLEQKKKMVEKWGPTTKKRRS